MRLSQVVDYTSSPLVSQLAKMEPFDVVLDCIGVLSLYQGSAKFLRPERPYLAIGLDLHGLSTMQSVGAFLRLFTLGSLPGFLGGAGRKIKVYSMAWDQKALKELTEMVGAGEIRVPIDGEYGWEKEDVMKAYDRQMSARVSVESLSFVRYADPGLLGARKDHYSDGAGNLTSTKNATLPAVNRESTCLLSSCWRVANRRNINILSFGFSHGNLVANAGTADHSTEGHKHET